MTHCVATVLMVLSSLVIFAHGKENQCPGGKASCPDYSTCCVLSNGSFGCCPIQNAVCCGDSVHCCPDGYTCDVIKGICKMGGESVPLLKKNPATPTKNEIGSANIVKCNQKFACPDRYTCCEVDSSYKCCPMAQAVCCSDHIHCCPRGYKCSLDGKTCSSGVHTLLALSTTSSKTLKTGFSGLLGLITRKSAKGEKSPSINYTKMQVSMTAKLLDSVVCPDGASQCPDGNTCCKLSSGQWGCCPLPQAVCCSDGLHCCPNGYTCDVSAGTCSRGSQSIAMLKKIPALKRNSQVNNIVCPDGESQCPDGNTCCKLSSGEWGCCPLPQAVCCSDGIHCCPHGYVCDSTGCSRKSKRIPMLQKMPASKTKGGVSSVVCPDGRSQCPDGNTCCKLSSGQWGCCPLPQAVCCSDGEHCCPNGYTCDVSSGTCSKGTELKALLEKTPAMKKKPEVRNVICPDGASECPDGNTCCKLSSGQYGCCPLPNAVCCSDGEHCCPEGYTCDVSAGTCSKGSQSTTMLQKILTFKKKPEVSNVICPDGASQCPDGNTCCKLSSGQWGCCPLPHAVCCSDGEHCCPEGYSCDVSSGTCSKGNQATTMLQKISALKRKPEATSVVCPDGASECPDGNTCCKLSSGQWGCCPLPNAVCCSDGEHCCPEGYTCDVSAGTCSKGSDVIDLFKKVPAAEKKAEVGNVICPDGQSECPDGNTCCKLSSGQWGCCPLPQAVCCSDGEHCCPHGYTCNVANGTCSREIQRTVLLHEISVLERKGNVNNVVCPDGQSQCPDGNTCCKLPSGQWGCCPLPEAVCCSDGEHCCPNGYTCDVSSGTCSKGRKIVPMLRKIPAFKRKTDVSNVICPDGQSECPDGNTCCKLASGQYGCCPLPNAVCCSDGEHCCPHGYTCNVANGTCSREIQRTVLLHEISVLERKGNVNNVVCPDGQSQCPDGNTCCKLPSGQWGCCPLPNAVCCSDGEHCCPEGYTCDVSAGTCSKGSGIVALLKKVPVAEKKAEVGNVICPDGQSECPDGSTCCKLSSGQWGCCPLPEAVCCSDGEHCCPNGYTCEVSSGTCSKGRKIVSMLKKIPAFKRKTDVSNVICPDGQSECPDGNTCCKLASGQYGCCPLPNAVCCSDGEHCCPHGYTCNVANGTCSREIQRTVLLHEISVLERKGNVNNVVCPDGQSQCPDGNTCCKLSSGQWGCCPLPNAVCCSDGEHCCPEGYTCDVSAGTCSKDSDIVALLKKVPVAEKKAEVGNVICPDGQSECPDGNTCCKLSSGQWGCCPLPEAVCCSDGEHCCPNGYTCDVSSGTCSKGSKIVPMLKKIPAFKRKTDVSNVICPDGQSECPDGNTCCKLSSGQWGCCPLPQAVCCSDGEHCCPNGYTCDVSSGTCKQGSQSITMLEKVPALKETPKVSSVVCPDGQSQCPDGNTCCKLASGQYGCCPLPNAVCCSDGEHCCPHGYTCNVANGTCSREIQRAVLLHKTSVLERKGKVNNVVCPDGQSQCPDGNTCCKLSSGQWGCCPLPNAVCCSDGEHCCPEGYTCDVSAGTCSKGSDIVALLKKVPVAEKKAEVGNVICPDGQSECPDGSTCCKLSSGQWGCCPLPQAVCCSDGEHCCPHGYTCDVSLGTCSKGRQSVPMLEKIPASTKPASVSASDGIVCPDKKYQCPKGSTCCRLPSGTYGCCPLENAVCCSDHKHCCPQGYACDVEAGKCNKTAEHINMINNIPAIKTSMDAELKYIYCPDGCACFDYETCCELDSGHYGCCPYSKAVCCSDHEHCCPAGYRCDLSAQMCVTGNVSLPMLRKAKSPRQPKTARVNLDEKIHFVPGRSQGGDSVTDDGFLWPKIP